MPRPYINLELRRLVTKRADCLCEYCLILDADGINFQVDHIISLKHGGATTADNFAYSCIFCNLQKGTDLGSINWLAVDCEHSEGTLNREWGTVHPTA